MAAGIVISWIIWVCVIVAILAFSFFVVKYYTDTYDWEWLPVIVATLSMSVTLCAVLLIPVDIYSAGVTKEGNETIQMLYYVMYGVILFLAFAVVPFTYFYFEEFDEGVSTKRRIMAGCKYTIILILIIVVLFIIGLFLKEDKAPDGSVEWFQELVDSEDKGESALCFAIACFTLLGYVVWLTYTAYGMAALPINLMKGRKHIAEEQTDVLTDIAVTREKQKSIQAKYITGERKISRKDEKSISLLKRKERILARQEARLEYSNTGWRKIFHFCGPFQIVFGIIFLLFTLLIVISVLLTQINKILTPLCAGGADCGFIMDYPAIFSPLDQLLVVSSQVFPLDYVLLALIIAYVFLATLQGTIFIGIRFLWINLFSIRAHRSQPQGLLLASVILMLATLVLNMQIMTIAPQYSTFGSQTFIDYAKNATVAGPCHASAPPDQCTMTEIAQILNLIQFKTSFFGVIFYYATWAFIGTFLLALLFVSIRRKGSHIVAEEDDSDEEMPAASSNRPARERPARDHALDRTLDRAVDRVAAERSVSTGGYDRNYGASDNNGGGGGSGFDRLAGSSFGSGGDGDGGGYARNGGFSSGYGGSSGGGGGSSSSSGFGTSNSFGGGRPVAREFQF